MGLENDPSTISLKVITVAGTPSSGKTAVISHLANLLLSQGLRVGAAKFDALVTRDDEYFRTKVSIPSIKGLSDYICPDHYYVSNIQEVIEWGKEQKTQVLFIETAGLCLRCAPHITDIPAICVLDDLAGIEAPEKMGPILSLADVVVVTKADMVSQAEKEVVLHKIRQVNPGAALFQVNGLTGSGCLPLTRLIHTWEPIGDVANLSLRYSMPASICSYCTGEQRIGREFQSGNVKKIEC